MVKRQIALSISSYIQAMLVMQKIYLLEHAQFVHLILILILSLLLKFGLEAIVVFQSGRLVIIGLWPSPISLSVKAGNDLK